ncbi:MAG: hypothetical protein J0I48_19015 [Devosia sp.]|uniref:hypothetical protein n=1 Tax=Devosia sp. 66-22 TaxID=1895753 RepID=UPI000928DD95|nr:hypothetical protein [Devosia sp. 66-22]MBN9348257.1 hypothetical protein [Devosia sp.]OJX49002.1 MAG: hypothetical protein BGO81_10430 [Devosia sp. 66-22]
MTEHIVKWSDRIWDTLVRWRTWLVNAVLAVALVAPEVLQAPELAALVPPHWRPWLIASAFLLNILMRPRKAARARDFEAK